MNKITGENVNNERDGERMSMKFNNLFAIELSSLLKLNENEKRKSRYEISFQKLKSF